MSQPDCRTDPAEAPGDMEDIFLIHSDLTVGLTPVRALNESDALRDWLDWEMIGTRLLNGHVVSEPFRHLRALIGTGDAQHIVHVVRERILSTDGVPRGDVA